MDLSTQYLGLKLPHPLMLGASPLVDDLDQVKRAEDAGAAVIVMHSLFEEQIEREHGAAAALESHEESFAEAVQFYSPLQKFALSSDQYLEQLRRIKAAVAVPVIASLNGVSDEGWLTYAKLMEDAGADALELNVYRMATNPEHSAESIEHTTLNMVASIKGITRLPLAVKLSPFYTALANFAARLARAGADGLVLFNRFYQPDLDLEALEISPRLELSTSSELLLRLRWLAILSANLDVSFAASGGVHSASDALKAVMTGADGVQLVSEILKHGPERFALIRAELAEWLERHEYESLEQARDSMNSSRCPNPEQYERANYLRVLQSFRRSSI